MALIGRLFVILFAFLFACLAAGKGGRSLRRTLTLADFS